MKPKIIVAYFPVVHTELKIIGKDHLCFLTLMFHFHIKYIPAPTQHTAVLQTRCIRHVVLISQSPVMKGKAKPNN